MPMVSVIIPTYDRADLIRETLDSVLAQTFRDFEIIVVDDGSTDNTLDVLSVYGKKVRIVCQTNQGPAAARNAGIRESIGDFVAFLDSDDLWLPTKLECQIALLDAKPDLLWAYTDAESFDSETGRTLYLHSLLNRLYQGDVLSHLFLQDFIPSPTPIVRRDVFSEVGDFWNSHPHDDWDMWLRIARLYSIGLVNRPLARYRVHQGMFTYKQNSSIMYQTRMDIIRRAIERDPTILKPYENQSIARHCISIGRVLARNGNRVDARRLFLRAIKLEPSRVEAYLYCMSCQVGQPVLHFAIQFRHWLRRSGSLVRMFLEKG